LNAEQRPVSAKAMRAMLAEVKNEAPLGDAQTISDGSPKTNIYSQKTQIYSDASRVSDLKQSDIKTETFSNDESKVTQLKPRVITGELEKEKTKIYPLAADTAGGKKSRRGLAVGAILGSLLLAIGAIAAVYVVKPEAFRMNHDAANAEPEKKPMIVVVQENTNLADANANSANTNTVAEAPLVPTTPTVPTEAKQKETVAKTETKAKPEVKTSNGKNEAPTVDEPPDIYVDNDEVDGEPPVNPKTKQKFPVFVWRKMSPADRRKLRQALDLERQQEMEKRRIEIQRRNLPKPPTPNSTPY